MSDLLDTTESSPIYDPRRERLESKCKTPLESSPVRGSKLEGTPTSVESSPIYDPRRERIAKMNASKILDFENANQLPQIEIQLELGSIPHDPQPKSNLSHNGPTKQRSPKKYQESASKKSARDCDVSANPKQAPAAASRAPKPSAQKSSINANMRSKPARNENTRATRQSSKGRRDTKPNLPNFLDSQSPTRPSPGKGGATKSVAGGDELFVASTSTLSLAEQEQLRTWISQDKSMFFIYSRFKDPSKKDDIRRFVESLDD